MQKIAIVGTGNVGGNLGVRLSQSGLSVKFGARDPAKLAALLARCGAGTTAASIADAVGWADVVFLALPAAALFEVVRTLAPALIGKIVVDCNNSVARAPDGIAWAPVPEGSLTAALAALAPGAKLVKAFNTFGAEFHLDPIVNGVGIDVLMASDHADAKATLAEIAKSAGFTPIDAGSLRNAALLENLAILWIHLAMRGGQGREIAFKLQRRG